MIISSVELRNYRNIDSLKLSFSEGVNVFVGKNGQGKTNLLEALYLLSKGSSFRLGNNETLINKGHPERASVKALIEKQDLKYFVDLSLEPRRKTLLVNEKRKTSSYLLRHFPSVLFSPESLSSIKDGPDQRRQLVDDLLLSHSMENASLINEFKKCWKSRNRLLKDYRQGHCEKHQTVRLLESLEGNYLPLATELSYARISALNALKDPLNQAFQTISRNASVDISVEYVVSSKNSLSWSKEQLFDALQERVLELRFSEMDSGQSLVGPQKHDIRFLFAGEDSRYYCSQGQQRALILAFKMAQIMYHYSVHQEYPFLMLDDVLSELDQEKRESLIEFLVGIDSQIFLTTTDISCPSSFEGRRNLSVYDVSVGSIEKVS